MTNLSITPALILFVLIAAALLIGCLAYLFAGVFRKGVNNSDRHDAINVEIARDELNHIKDAHRGGQLSDEDFQQARTDLEARLAESLSGSGKHHDIDRQTVADDRQPAHRGRWIAIPGAVLLAGASIWLYQHVGDVSALSPPIADRQRVAAESDAENKLPSIEDMLPRLEEHLQTNAEDVEGWKLLGTTYHRLRRFHDAENALARALELAPEDAAVMLQLADSRVVLANGRFDNDTIALIDDGLLLEPDSVQGNWLRGMASEQTGDTQAAVDHWRRILPLLEADSASRGQLQQMIARAESAEAELSNDTATSGTSTGQTPERDAAAEVRVQVSVSLSAELQNQLSPELSVFVYARAIEGPPAPLAVARLTVADLPATVVLDDTLAMLPAFKLSGFDTVTIGARVAVSGNPVAQPGDWYAEHSPLSIPATPAVALEIDTAFGN